MSCVDLIGVIIDVIARIGILVSSFNTHTVPLLCDIYILAKLPCVKSSTLMVLMMSCERFYATFFPFGYKENVTKKRLVYFGCVSVVAAFFSTGLIPLTYSNENGRCFDERKDANQILVTVSLVESTVVFLVLPSVLTAVLNLFIAIEIKRRESVHT